MGTMVRRAGVADAAELVRLRAVMMVGLGERDDPASGWRDGAEAWFAEQLARPDRFAAYVVDEQPADHEPAADGRVISCAVGQCHDHAPSAGDPSVLRGHLFNVATDVDHRRRGHARACVEAVITWFAGETPVGVVELHASAGSGDLYARLGFRPAAHPAMRIALS